MNNEQIKLMKKIKLPHFFDRLLNCGSMHIEDRLADEMQLGDMNSKGNSLNNYGMLCLSIIETILDK